MRDVARSLACALGALVILAAPAVAQEAASASVDPSAAQPAAQSTPVSPGTLTVERVPSGWVISPDVTTEFSKSGLIGACGGWLSDRAGLGMGGYGSPTTRQPGDGVGGALSCRRWRTATGGSGFAVSQRGEATVTAPYRDVYGWPRTPADVVFGHGSRPDGRRTSRLRRRLRRTRSWSSTRDSSSRSHRRS